MSDREGTPLAAIDRSSGAPPQRAAAERQPATTAATGPAPASVGLRLTAVQLGMALACIVFAVFGGVLAALHYLPALSPVLHDKGLALTKLRPLHTTFATLWIFGGAIAVMYHWLAHHERGLDRGDVRRFWFHTGCWLLAGAGVIATLATGVFSGREYLDQHWALSTLLLAGWIAFAWTFLKRGLPRFWQQPVYVYFWTVGVLYFAYTFTEGHAYLLPWVQERPVQDLALHWKSCGTLVGSFNFLVYGSLVYLTERLSGDRRYGQSTLAFALFGVGCLNSFTNYAHHTYHLPQSHAVKWIAFVVSMSEAIILWRLLIDVVKLLRKRAAGARYDAALGYLLAAKWWTTAMLAMSILISVPSFNSLMHGTHMVTGHAMGTELGIDSMVLFGGVAFLLAELHRGRPGVQAYLNAPVMRAHAVVLNAAMAVLVAWLSASGLVHGIYRYQGLASPEWVTGGRILFPITGTALALALLYLVWRWAPLLRRRAEPHAAVAAGEPAPGAG